MSTTPAEIPAEIPTATSNPPSPPAPEPTRYAAARRVVALGGIGAAALLAGAVIGARSEPPQTAPQVVAADTGAGQLRLTWLVRPRPAVQQPAPDV